MNDVDGLLLTEDFHLVLVVVAALFISFLLVFYFMEVMRGG